MENKLLIIGGLEKFSRTKTKYLECKCGKCGRGSIETQVIPEEGSLKYVRSLIQENSEIDHDVLCCIGSRWLK